MNFRLVWLCHHPMKNHPFVLLYAIHDQEYYSQKTNHLVLIEWRGASIKKGKVEEKNRSPHPVLQNVSASPPRPAKQDPRPFPYTQNSLVYTDLPA